MRKTLTALSILMLAFCPITKAQQVYPKSSYAKAGENFLVGSIFIDRDTMQLDSISQATFDFRKYPHQRVDTVFFRNPSYYETRPYFDDVDLALESSRQFSRMLRTEADTIWQVGFLGDYLHINANVVLPFHKPGFFQIFPVKLGLNYRQRIKRKIKTPYHFREGIDSIRKVYDIRKHLRVLGEGAVQTPYGYYEGILQKTEIKKKVRGFSYSSFGWTPSRRLSDYRELTIFRWFDPDYGYPVATIVTNKRDYVIRMEYLLELPMKLSLRTKDITCYGGSDGRIFVEAKGGVPNYTFKWKDRSTGHFRKELPAGTYSVTVTDNKGHTKDTAITLTQPETPMQVEIDARDESCYGAFDGMLAVNIRNGKKPYQIRWSNGGRKDSLTQIHPGTYWIRVKDRRGCVVTDTATVEGASGPLRVHLKSSEAKCKGRPGGRIKTQIRGGVKPYSFKWSTGDTMRQLDSVPAGNYTLTVTDAHGCTQMASATVQQPEKVLALNFQKRDVTCHGLRDGKASVKVRGGVPGYRIRWFDGTTTNKVDGLAAGHYSVVVTDRNGCRKQHYFSIKEPDPLKAEIDRQKPLRHLPNGALYACLSGGTPPYDLQWSNGSKANYVDSLPSARYSLKVTDSYNCTLKKTRLLTPRCHYGYSLATLDSVTRYRGATQRYVVLHNVMGKRLVKYMEYERFMQQKAPKLSAGVYFVQVWQPGRAMVFKGQIMKAQLGRIK